MDKRCVLICLTVWLCLLLPAAGADTLSSPAVGQGDQFSYFTGEGGFYLRTPTPTPEATPKPSPEPAVSPAPTPAPTQTPSRILSFPQGLVRIEAEGFFGDLSLDEVILPQGVQYIGPRAFAQSSVRLIRLPRSLQKIDESAFEGCAGVEVIAPQDSYAFSWCLEHGIRCYAEGAIAQILFSESELTVKNGGSVSVQLETLPAQVPASRLAWSSSDEVIFTVDQNGVVFGQYPGRAVLTVSAKDGGVSASIPVVVQANYRAVLFSESTFSESYGVYTATEVIQRNRGDVRLMKAMLASVTGPDGGRYIVSDFDDLSAPEVYDKITQLLEIPSREGDVSLFFIATHGDHYSMNYMTAGALACKNRATHILLPELADALARVKGRVIVLLESCGPGAALVEFNSGDGETAKSSAPQPDDGEWLLTPFIQADPGISVYRSADLPQDALQPNKNVSKFVTEDKFLVMTAGDYLETTYMFDGRDQYNLFPVWLTRGVGESGPMPADTENGNGDGALTLQEWYSYVYQKTYYRQTPRVHPKNCTEVIFRRTAGEQ